MAGDCGHPVTSLVYFNFANCLSDICWTWAVMSHTVLWQGYYMCTHLVSWNVLYKLKLQKAVLCMYRYTEGELYNWSLTFEVILCTDYINWFACLLFPYFKQQNALNKYNRTDHKSHSILGANSFVFWLEGIIHREFRKNKGSYFLLYILSCLYLLDCVYKHLLMFKRRNGYPVNNYVEVT